MSSEAPGHKTGRTMILHSCCNHTEATYAADPNRGLIPHVVRTKKNSNDKTQVKEIWQKDTVNLCIVLHYNNRDGQKQQICRFSPPSHSRDIQLEFWLRFSIYLSNIEFSTQSS